MKTHFNFKSVVTVGSFNPSILTPDFLREHCNFSPEHKPEGTIAPVMSQIKYGNIVLSMELNRFQIHELKCNDLNSDPPLALMMEYLRVLEFTPLSLMGVNFNYGVTDLSLGKLAEVATNPLQLGEFFGLDPTSVGIEARKPNGKGLGICGVIMAHQLNSDIKNSTKLTFENEGLTVNNNYEVNRLDKDRSRIRLIEEAYPSFVANNDDFIKKLGELV